MADNMYGIWNHASQPRQNTFGTTATQYNQAQPTATKTVNTNPSQGNNSLVVPDAGNYVAPPPGSVTGTTTPNPNLPEVVTNQNPQQWNGSFANTSNADTGININGLPASLSRLMGGNAWANNTNVQNQQSQYADLQRNNFGNWNQLPTNFMSRIIPGYSSMFNFGRRNNNNITNWDNPWNQGLYGGQV